MGLHRVHPSAESRPSGTKTSFALRAAMMAAFVFVGDQAIKGLVRQWLTTCAAPRLAQCDRLDLAGLGGLVRVENAGSAMGFWQGWSLWVLVAGAGALLIPLYARRLPQSRVAAAAVGLQIGGALGNLADRLLLGGVVDYLHLWFVSVVFNLADVAILVGMVLATRALLPALTTPAASTHLR